jgi:hypothetical protein
MGGGDLVQVKVWFRRTYGQGPVHLLTHLAGFAVAAFAFDKIFSGGQVEQLLEWYLGFALLHDLAFVPLYVGVDRGVRAIATRLPARRDRPRRAVALVNHVRAPAIVAGLLLLIYAPLITGVGAHTYFAASGHHVSGYLRNWLLITAALFAASALVYAARVWALRRAAAR